MRKRFIILTNGANAEQQDIICKSFPGFGWWHRMPQAWLLIDPKGQSTAKAIRETITSKCPGLYVYVFSAPFGEDGHSGFGPSEWNKWIDTEWVKQ